MNDFIEYKYINHNNTFILIFDVKKEQPTAFEWTCAIEQFKENMELIKEKKLLFAYIFDVRLMGILSIARIKEFVNLMSDMSELLESKLICSAAIAEGQIVKKLFEVVKLFYNTKKPLKIVNTLEDAYLFIDECKADSLNLF